MWVKSCCRTARSPGHLPGGGWEGRVFVWACKLGCVFVCVREEVSFCVSLLSSCQPLEIPGNVIQSHSLKKSLCQEFPWSTETTRQFVVEGRRRIMQKKEKKKHSDLFHNTMRYLLFPSCLCQRTSLVHISASEGRSWIITVCYIFLISSSHSTFSVFLMCMYTGPVKTHS